MNNEALAKRMAEALRKLFLKLDAISKLTKWEVFEYFHDIDELVDVLVDIHGMYPDDASYDDVSSYLKGDISYEELLELVAKSND